VVESEHLRLELQMVETERVRLSLLEEKVVDVLQLLQRLRDLVGSPGVGGRRLAGAIYLTDGGSERPAEKREFPGRVRMLGLL
jgi:hypothetical protein